MTASLPFDPPESIDSLLPPLAISYEFAALSTLFADARVLAVIGFGSAAPAMHTDPRYLRVALEPVTATAPFEVWRTRAPVHGEHHGALRCASDGDYMFGALEIQEPMLGGISAATRDAYQIITAQVAASGTPHILRIWNYLDAINSGDGDAERYRQFCSGRAAGMQTAPRSVFSGGYPAATAIGVRDGRRVLQVYWLAARLAGKALENPRQTSAWRYPREYGPAAPGFARAMRAPTQGMQLYISGTAAIVGHASHHHDDLTAQFEETLANLGSLLDAAKMAGAETLGSHTLLKAYVRRDEHAESVRVLLGRSLPQTQPLLLRGDICRRELLIEIDGIHDP